MLRRGISLVLLCLLLWAGWMVWQPPPEPVSLPVQMAQQALPDRPGDAPGLWRVVSRRMIVPKAAKALERSLLERGLTPITVAHQEEVELHAFDDPRTFDAREDAVQAREIWKKSGFEAELIGSDGRFGVALGRLYMVAYAQALQRRLEQEKHPYTYHRRQVNIPTWRFTFAAAAYAEAKLLWSKVQAMGMADPVLMHESRFRSLFGEGLPLSPAES